LTWPVVAIRVHVLQKSSDESNSSRADDLSGADPVISMSSEASLCYPDCDLNGHCGWPSSLLLVSYSIGPWDTAD